MSYLYDIFELGISGIRSGEYWTSNVYNEDSNGDPEVCITYVLLNSRWLDRERIEVNAAGIWEIKLPLVLVKDLS